MNIIPKLAFLTNQPYYSLELEGSPMEYPIIEIKLSSEKYPKLLKEIAVPPAQLFCRGNIELLNSPCFAVVGTRRITPYGREAANQLTTGLARHFTIVSGLALGIDAIAHQSALDIGGHTIAVLGTDVKNPRPYANSRLAQQILKSGGLIISENEGAEVHQGTFPIRNRIISGLSKGVLVVEADEKSGSLITARVAGEQNRDVFAVPGSIFSQRSQGPHSLLKNGAKLVASVNDILEEYDHLKLDKRPSLSTQDPLAEIILAILHEKGECEMDDLIATAKSDAPTIISKVAVMEIQGMLSRMNNGKLRAII